MLKVNEQSVPFLEGMRTGDLANTLESIPHVFNSVDALAECFDDPVMKAAALSSVLTNMPDKGYVGASGVAGYGDSIAIRTQKIRDHIYI